VPYPHEQGSSYRKLLFHVQLQTSNFVKLKLVFDSPVTEINLELIDFEKLTFVQSELNAK